MPERTNRQWLLASRPQGEPTPENFKLAETPAPTAGPGQLLVKNLFMSVDPYMRGRMSDRASYARPTQIGEVMGGGTVSQVLVSNSPTFQAGDIVVGYGGWQDYAAVNADERGLLKVDRALPLSAALGVTGMPGVTAYFGLLKLGEPKPGETVVVSAASGAVGSVVGQIAKILGCRVVGVAGGPEKCAFCKTELGFDDCIDYKAGDLDAALQRACPKGIDVYFENVGGAVLRAVAKLLNHGARVPICGFISQYNTDTPETPEAILSQLADPPARRFFLVWEWPDEYAAATVQLATWVKEGTLKYREDVVSGLENAPRAFIGVLRGENFGKKVVKIADAS